MKLLLLAVLAVALGMVQPTTQPVVPERLEIVLLVGQSNMAGRGKLDEESLKEDPRLWMLTQSREWRPAVDPLHFDKPTMVGVGPGKTAGLVLAQAWAKPVGLVPAAFGGSSIEQWGPGKTFYVDAIARAKEAMKRGRLRAILWHQGEANSGEDKVGKYAAQLEELIARFRHDLNAPNLPFVIGEIGEWKGKKTINEVMRTYPTTHPHTACVSAEGLTDKGDQLHFSTEGARELGRRYAAAVIDLQKKNEPPMGHR